MASVIAHYRANYEYTWLINRATCRKSSQGFLNYKYTLLGLKLRRKGWGKYEHVNFVSNIFFSPFLKKRCILPTGNCSPAREDLDLTPCRVRFVFLFPPAIWNSKCFSLQYVKRVVNNKFVGEPRLKSCKSFKLPTLRRILFECR